MRSDGLRRGERDTAHSVGRPIRLVARLGLSSDVKHVFFVGQSGRMRDTDLKSVMTHCALADLFLARFFLAREVVQNLAGCPNGARRVHRIHRIRTGAGSRS
jgi:hypothetical protein